MENYDSPLHIISAQISELGITFASKSVDGKSNEIPAVQQLIAELDLQDCMIVADALNCQKETAEAVIKSKGDYLLDAKGNQPTATAFNYAGCHSAPPPHESGIPRPDTISSRSRWHSS